MIVILIIFCPSILSDTRLQVTRSRCSYDIIAQYAIEQPSDRCITASSLLGAIKCAYLLEVRREPEAND